MRRLLWFACAYALTALVCVYLLPVPPVWVGIVVLCLGLGLTFLRRRSLRYLITVLLGIGVGLSWVSFYYSTHIQPAADFSNTTQTVTGTVCSYPQPTAYGYKVEFELQTQEKEYRTLLFLDEEAADLRPGDRVTTSAKLEQASFSYSQEHNVYYRALGYVLVAYANGELIVGPAARLPVRFIPVWAAHQLKMQIETLFATDTVAFMKALLTGDRSGFDYQTKNALSLAGVSHVVAISGMHVSILLGLVLFFLPNRRLAALVGIPIVLFYTVLTGASPSTVRAAVMQIMLLLAPLLGREEDLPTSLSAAGLVILLRNPWAIADLSFQLSFAAMAGLLLFSHRLYRAVDAWIEAEKPIRPVRAFAKALNLSVSTTVGAMVFTTPLIACSFGVVSLVSVVANFLTLWCVSICFQAGVLICLLGYLLPGVAGALAWLIAWLIRYFLWVTQWLAGLPFAAIYTDNSYTVLVLLFVYLLIGTFLLCRHGRNAIAFAGCVGVAVALCVTLSVAESRTAQIQTTVLDVGQGQCVLLEWDGMTAMVDCGGSYPEDAGEKAARLLLSHGRQSLDVLVLTHFDADHAGGIPQLLRRVDVERLYLPPAEADDSLCTQILQTAAQTHTQVLFVTQDLVLEHEMIRMRLFAPVSYHPGNDGGLSVLCSKEDYDILITGDMSFEAEHRLLALHDLPRTELLLAGHHGSATSTGTQLLQTVQPDMVLISVGSENRYGDPTQEALDRITTSGASVYRTDVNSTIIIRR